MRQRYAGGMDPSIRRHGFTLIELLVVITVVVTLASMLMVTLPMVREQATTVHCASQLRQVGMACEGYAQNQEGFFPWSIPNPNFYFWLQTFDGTPHGLGCLYPDYLDGNRVISCPAMPLIRGIQSWKTRYDMVLRIAGYRYNGNPWSTPASPSQGVSFLAPDVTNAGVGNGWPKGPNLLIDSNGKSSAKGGARTILAFDQITEQDTDWKSVIHPHRGDRTVRSVAPVPLVRGGNALFADGHVGLIPGYDWALTGGANNNFVPRIGY